MTTKHHVAGTIGDAVIWIRGNVVEEEIDCLCRCVCGVVLLSTDGAEANKQLVVDGLCNVQKGANNVWTQRTPLALGGGLLLSSMTYYVFAPQTMGRCLCGDSWGFLGSQVIVPKEDGAHVAVHCEASCAGSVVPSKIDAVKLLASPILRDVIIFCEDGRNMVGLLFSNIFDAKITHY